MDDTEKSNYSFKWPVSATRHIKAPVEKIWAVISSPGNLAHCHPFCENNPVEKWPGKGSLDSVYYYSGWVYHRQLRLAEKKAGNLKFPREFTKKATPQAI